MRPNINEFSINITKLLKVVSYTIGAVQEIHNFEAYDY